MDKQIDNATLRESQEMLDQVNADVVRLEEFVAWFTDATQRVRALEDAYRGPVQDALAETLGRDPGAVTWPVANEDAVWEASASFHDGVLGLLRAVTDALTEAREG
ncbi:hypothetical protein PCC79_14830 [Propioniciclava soli]|uniref:DUF4298 domain-containing protein n=1 Tax=Propioniciclava soli TaxID=2775081 RepID=A0ABZ3C6G3_9ACTN